MQHIQSCDTVAMIVPHSQLTDTTNLQDTAVINGVRLIASITVQITVVIYDRKTVGGVHRLSD